jgi:transposase-like protein
MDKKTEAQIINEYTTNGFSYRMLAKKYGVPHVRIYRVMMASKKNQQQAKEIKVAAEYPLPDDVKTLKEELRKARLKIELQDLMIDISSKELGIDLRKKHGTKRSK